MCSIESAVFSLAKNGWACVVCNGCKFQGFARGDLSDRKLREYLAGAKTEAELAKPAPAAPALPAAKPAAKPPADDQAPRRVGFW